MPKINAPTIDEHKTLTRNALLEAGADAFTRFGLSGTSIGTLADMAGIARTTVYEYFPNKEAVLAALINDRIPPLVEQVVEDLPTGDPLASIETMLTRSLRFVDENPVESTLLFRVSRELPKPERDEAWSVFDEIKHEVMALCHEGVAAGQFPDQDPVSLGRIVTDHMVGGVDELSVRGPGATAAVLETRVAFLRGGLTVRE